MLLIVINSQHVRAMPPTPSPSLVSRPHFFTSVRKTDCSTSPFFVQVHRNACVLLFLKLTLNIIEDYTFYTVCYNNLLIKDVETRNRSSLMEIELFKKWWWIFLEFRFQHRGYKNCFLIIYLISILSILPVSNWDSPRVTITAPAAGLGRWSERATMVML